MDQATAQTHLDAWLAADLAVSQGKSYAIGDRQLTRLDAKEIRDSIAYWTRVVRSYETKNAGGNAVASIATWNP